MVARWLDTNVGVGASVDDVIEVECGDDHNGSSHGERQTWKEFPCEVAGENTVIISTSPAAT